jgi:hypothetical protein
MLDFKNIYRVTKKGNTVTKVLASDFNEAKKILNLCDGRQHYYDYLIGGGCLSCSSS